MDKRFEVVAEKMFPGITDRDGWRTELLDRLRGDPAKLRQFLQDANIGYENLSDHLQALQTSLTLLREALVDTMRRQDLRRIQSN